VLWEVPNSNTRGQAAINKTSVPPDIYPITLDQRGMFQV
jgi:hypothetical protein